jgi:hypothetical protein
MTAQQDCQHLDCGERRQDKVSATGRGDLIRLLSNAARDLLQYLDHYGRTA